MIDCVHDTSALASLHAACFDRPWSEESFTELLKGDGVHALGDANGFIVIRCVADEAEILTLGVLPARRRAGLARKLVRAAMELAVTQYQGGACFSGGWRGKSWRARPLCRIGVHLPWQTQAILC